MMDKMNRGEIYPANPFNPVRKIIKVVVAGSMNTFVRTGQ
jgi:hypothetical protein